MSPIVFVGVPARGVPVTTHVKEERGRMRCVDAFPRPPKVPTVIGSLDHRRRTETARGFDTHRRRALFNASPLHPRRAPRDWMTASTMKCQPRSGRASIMPTERSA